MGGNIRYDYQKQDTQSIDGVWCIWGIFMLVALIGGGQVMQDTNVKPTFKGFATNSGFCGRNKTSDAYKGFRLKDVIGIWIMGECGTYTQARRK